MEDRLKMKSFWSFVLLAFSAPLALAANVDTENGCGTGKAASLAQEHCSDYSTSPLFAASP